MPWSAQAFIYSLFLLSGATALVYEVAWTRTFSLIFGVSYEAVSIVLGAFMAGLALGSFYFGKRSMKTERPLRLYAWLELGIGAAGLLLPWLLRLVDEAYVAVAIRQSGVTWTVQFLRVAMAFGVLLLPTFFMGGTLPVLTRFMVRQEREFGVRLAGLYGTNTVGAVLGVVASGFLLLPWLGVTSTQHLAVAANLAVGAAAWLADGRFRRLAAPAPSPPAGQVAARGKPPAPGREALSLPWAPRLAFWGAGVSGFCALALEVLWTRAISISTGLSTYSFTIMLAAFLVGISLGSMLHAILPLRRWAESTQFAVVFIIIGLSSLATSQLIPQLPQWAMEINYGIHGAQGTRWGTALILSLAVMLIPCTFMGIAFPLAGQARARLVESVGESVGTVLGLNTVGAILGSLLAGFALIPLLGLQRGMLCVSAIYAGYGVLVLAVRVSETTRRRWAPGLAAAAAWMVIAGLPFVLESWDQRTLGAFCHNSPGLYVRDGKVDVQSGLEATRLLYYREGRGSTVSVFESQGRRVFQVDGKSEAGDELLDLHHELLLGHVPAFLHREPKSAAIIGLGAGITLAAIAAHPSFNRLVIIELEPAVFEAARQFDDVNDHAVAIDPGRLEIVYQDGRNYLLTTGEKFDVISADSIHPWVRGSAYLYTSEYYAMLVDHLTPGGILCQWLPIYELSVADVKSVLATFAANIEHTQLWYTGNDALLIGSRAPIRIDLADFERRLQTPAVARHLGYLGLEDPLSFLAELTMDDQSLRSYSAGAILNTDDNLYLEFSSPLSISVPHNQVTSDINSRQAIPVEAIENFSARFPTVEDLRRTLQLYDQAKKETVAVTLDLIAGHGGDWNQRLGQVLQRVPDYARAKVFQAFMLTQTAEVLLGQGKVEQAVDLCRKAASIRPGFGRAHYTLARALERQNKRAEAAESFRKSLACRSLRYWESYVPLSVVLDVLGRKAEAIQILNEGLREKPGDPQIAARLAQVQRAAPGAAHSPATGAPAGAARS